MIKRHKKARRAVVTFVDRLDRTFQLGAEAGQSILSLLSSLHIPLDSVVVEQNGEIVNEEIRICAKDSIVIRMVRAYHLYDFLKELHLWEKNKLGCTGIKTSCLYTKRLLWFEKDGQANLVSEGISRKEFPDFLENIFVQGILEKKLIQEGDTIGLALSGGRDSLALLYLLSNTRDKLPSFKLEGVTVCETSNIRDVEIAYKASKRLGVEHKLLDGGVVKKMFGLKVPMEEALKTILERYGLAKAINCAHAYVKTCVERYFGFQSIYKIAFGLHNEDLLASLLRSIVNGIPFGESFYQKTWGPFNFIYPLWGITKKELTIYLDVVAPKKHGSQGNPAAFDRGGHSRDIQYFIADSLQTLWPGFSYHVFEGYQKLFSEANIAIKYQNCRNCQGLYVVDEENEKEQNQSKNICYLCKLLLETNQLEGGKVEQILSSSFSFGN